MQQEIEKKLFCFIDNCTCICGNKLSVSVRECLSLTVNVLTDSPKISDITKRDRHILTCGPSEGVLEQDFGDIYLTTAFAVRNFGDS